jgi:hypothetical protein
MFSETNFLLTGIKEKLNVFKNDDILPSIDELILRQNTDKLKENVI